MRSSNEQAKSYGLVSKGSDERLVSGYALQNEFFDELRQSYTEKHDNGRVLMRMRILREAIIGNTNDGDFSLIREASRRYDGFASLVFKFCARTAIDLSDTSVFATVYWILFDLHPICALTDVDQKEFASYLMLQYCDQDNLAAAQEVGLCFGIDQDPCGMIIRAIISKDYVGWRNAECLLTERQKKLIPSSTRQIRHRNFLNFWLMRRIDFARTITQAYHSFPLNSVIDMIGGDWKEYQSRLRLDWVEHIDENGQQNLILRRREANKASRA